PDHPWRPGGLAQNQRDADPPLLLNQNVECAAGRTQRHGLEPDAALRQRRAHRRGRKALRRTGAEQYHLRCERQNRLEVSGRQVGETLRLPIGDQAVRRDDAAALHAVLADADLGSRVASDQVGARTRFERELHAAVTIAPVREIVIVIADLYLPHGTNGAPPGAAAATSEPARSVGGDLAAVLPQGRAAGPLRRLLAEIAMCLDGQALNEARRCRGEPPVTSLWPWGAAGRAVQPERLAARPMPRAFGADPYVSGLWGLQADLCRALPGRLEEVLPDERARGVVLVV